MLHRLDDYTDSDLTVAIRSPYRTDAEKAEIEAEITRRKFERNIEIECILKRQ